MYTRLLHYLGFIYIVKIGMAFVDLHTKFAALEMIANMELDLDLNWKVDSYLEISIRPLLLLISELNINFPQFCYGFIYIFVNFPYINL